MEKDLLDNLVRQLTVLGSSVGFEPEGNASPVEGENPPEGTLIWRSSFAVLALIPVSKEALKSTAREAQEWLWSKITAEEKKARFLDGYLVLVLSASPDNVLRDEASNIELDTSVCRKHVIWPTAAGEWEHKLWAVTCLGLPETHASTSAGVAIPALPAAAVRSLDYYETLKNYEAVADKLIEEARLAATRAT